MPFKNPEDRRAYQAKRYAAKLADGWLFKQSEAKRKAEWLQREESKRLNAEASKRARQKAD